MKIRLIPTADIRKAWALESRYVRKRSFPEFKRIYGRFPKLRVGAYDCGRLVGICLGRIDKKDVILNATAVDYRYWRKGVGSKMLRFFERRARSTGKRILSVGSARGYVEKFYKKNGFMPTKKRNVAKTSYVVMHKTLR